MGLGSDSHFDSSALQDVTDTWKVNEHCRIPEQSFIFFCFGAKLIQSARKYVPVVLTAIFPGVDAELASSFQAGGDT